MKYTGKLKLYDATRPHKVGTVVPPGGSSCASCKFFRIVKSSDGKADHCVMREWVMTPKSRGGGGGKTHLPVIGDRWCCDFWELRR